MNRVMLLRIVYLFGSHTRGDARPDGDVDDDRKKCCVPRKPDFHIPADWLLIAASHLELVRLAARNEISHEALRPRRAAYSRKRRE